MSRTAQVEGWWALSQEHQPEISGHDQGSDKGLVPDLHNQVLAGNPIGDVTRVGSDEETPHVMKAREDR